MIKLGDRFYLILMIDGKEVPIEYMGFNPLQMHSNVLFFQPVGRIVLADKQRYFDNNPISDGSKVDIFVWRTDTGSQSAKRYQFRLFRHAVNKSLNINYFTLYLTFNCPRYFNENMTGAMKGTSYDILKEMAKTVGVDYSGDPTSDAMTWLGTGKKRCVFARDVALHGYANTQSCMSLGMTLLGEMRYKDVSAIKLKDNPNIFVQGVGDNTKVFQVLGRKEINKAGLFNNLVGYRMTTVEQDTSGVSEHASVQVTMNSGPTLSVNKTLNDKLEGSRVHFTPVSAGNVHPQFYQAEHSNKRIRAMYSFGSHIVTDGMTNLDLFDPITYLFYDNSANKLSINQAISGNYIITAKTIFATKEGRYFEKFEIVRQGPNFYNELASVLTATNSAA